MTTTFDPAACEARFIVFFMAVHGHEPFPWQRRLAIRVCTPAQNWPKAIALPTAAGKTSCIDIAVFALAYRTMTGHPRTAPRRIFFVVDRRIVVDQAYEHARKKLAVVLDRSDEAPCREVADQLRDIAQPGWLALTPVEQDRILAKRREILDQKDVKKRQKLRESLDELEREWVDLRPLDVYALRGGMYREDTWIRSPLQPTVITSTVDQVGSRLLFRGYGVSDGMKPVHAGLVGNDALILLDEAHCSRPFAEAVASVTKYRGWHKELAPFAFVQMTATPTGDVPVSEIERDQKDDQTHPFLSKRINAKKPTALVVTDPVKGKKWQEPLVRKLVEAASNLMGRTAQGGADEVRSVGVIVNRVATARAVHAALLATERSKPEGERSDVLLLTGRMRPLDRDTLLDQLRPLFTGSKRSLDRPTYVVATQCLEVGADLDFHALVSECASLDALRQRFGRLNRHAQDRTFAPGVIVVRADQTEPVEKEADQDFVYKNALANTWKWLRGEKEREEVDFGVAAMREMTGGVDLGPLNTPAVRFPALLPAHLDCWVQTAPIPTPDPDPALYLHGVNSGQPDVQVVFRADLGDDPTKWAEIVALCPPSSSEALPVRISDFRKWMAAADQLPDDTADVEGLGSQDEGDEPTDASQALRWEGPEKSKLVKKTDDVWAKATYVIPATADRLELLGDFPAGGRPTDHGEAAFQRSRDRAVLRLTWGVVSQWPESVQRAVATAIEVPLPEQDDQPPAANEFVAAFEKLAVRHEDGDDISETLEAVLNAITDGPEWLTDAATRLRSPKNRLVARHPVSGLVLTGKRRLRKYDPTFADDESSESPARRQVTLDEHTGDVMAFADRFVSGCGLGDFRDQFALAARWHDLGKSDPRFQAMLRGGSPRSAAGRELLGKSGAAPSTPQEREAARAVHLYPKGGRHELLSVAFAAERTDDPLILHLTGTHHGDGRPLASPYQDGTRDQVRDLLPPHVLLFDEHFPWPSAVGDPITANATGPDRFWHVVREYGWWGTAYLEAVFRLADQAASRAEQGEEWKAEAVTAAPLVPQATASRSLLPLPMIGLDGSNPLGFLAALGAVRCLTTFSRRSDRPAWLDGDVKLSWGRPDAPFAAVLHLPRAPSPEEFAEFLASRLDRDLATHPAALAVALAEGKDAAAENQFTELCRGLMPDQLDQASWAVAHYSELIPGDGSQLLVVRSDYLRGNFRSVVERTTAEHIRRSLFARWDYADGLDNQSLHWEPSEDRRHAYQWHQPNGDPTKKRRGGMLGANRLALEAWPLFLSVPLLKKEKLRTRGFRGEDSRDTFWTWPVWSCPVGVDTVASLLSLPELQEAKPDSEELSACRVFGTFRSQRILVGKTPNLTPAATA